MCMNYFYGDKAIAQIFWTLKITYKRQQQALLEGLFKHVHNNSTSTLDIGNISLLTNALFFSIKMHRLATCDDK